MTQLCDECGAKAVNDKACKPLFEIYGNRIRHHDGVCDFCSKPAAVTFYPDLNAAYAKEHSAKK